MQQVIIWSVAGGICVFAVGLISAIGSRRQRKYRSHTRPASVKNFTEDSTKKNTVQSNMAAGGSANGEETLQS